MSAALRLALGRAVRADAHRTREFFVIVQAALAPAERAFVEAVRAFVAEHWDVPAAPPAGWQSPRRSWSPHPRELAWFEALVAQGWSVPDWPLEQGGTGWPTTWQYLWRRELALAGAPALDEAGVEWAGPALWICGDARQQARFLPAIREARERWCLGLVEAEAGSDIAATRTRARRAADGYVVDGCKSWVAGAEHARWMLALARTGADVAEPEAALSLLVVDLRSPGVVVRPIATLGGLPGVCRVDLRGVGVPLDRRLGVEGNGFSVVRTLEARAQRRFEPAQGLRVLVAQLEQVAADLPGNDGALAEEPGFARRLAELAVDLAGLEALEQRHVWAGPTSGQAPNRDSRNRGSDPGACEEPAGEVLPLVLRLRHTGISQRLADLFVEALGYYSLPYPDPLTIDNEGPIGHHYALAALRGMFARRLPPADEGHGERLRDRIANQLLGY